jgi:hypothetical protein
MRRLSFLLAFLFFVPSLAAQRPQTAAPDTVIRQIIHTRDGSTLIGRVVGEDSVSVRFETSGGVLTLARSAVQSIETVKASAIHDGEYWFPDPNRTRLFFGPTGRMLDRGEGYYQNTYLVLQNFVGGINDYVTMGGGFSLIPGVDPTHWLYYVTPKVGVYRSEGLNIAVGGLAGFVPNADINGFGVAYGAVTKGGPDGSITAGVGVGYAGSTIASKPVFLLGGEQRVSRRIALLTENYLYVGRTVGSECTINNCSNAYHYQLDGVASYGLRFLGEKLSVDLAFFNVLNPGTDKIFPGIPYISFGAKF